MTPIVDILWRLEGVKKSGDGWSAKCPGHDDNRSSLSVGTGRDGKLLLHCHAGCTFEQLASILQLDTSSPAARRIEATYDYFDEQGNLLYQVVRFVPKDFRQRRPAKDTEPTGDDPDPRLAPRGWVWKMTGVRRVLYRLPGVLEAVRTGRTIYVVEGEKDVENLTRAGLSATCNVGGAGKWRREYCEHLRGAEVVILPDADKPGEDHAADVAQQLQGVAKSVRTVHLPAPHKDASDFIAAGGDVVALTETALAAPAIAGVPADWRADLVWKINSKNKAERLEYCLSNAIAILTNDPAWSGVFQLDAFAQEIVVAATPPYELNGHEHDPRPLRDDDYARAAAWLQASQYRLLVGVETVAQALGALAQRATFHPVREYLDGLEWDGVERISHWLEDHCGAGGSSIGAGGDDLNYVRAVSRAWLISAVARIYQPGCKADHVLILEGAQGVGKSTIFKVLAGGPAGGPPGAWFTDEIDALGSKDAGMQVQGSWVIELSELDALSRSEVTRTKAFLSKSFDRFRPPYGRTVVRFDRQCVFAGTVNHTEYLRDETGGRRFWPVSCHGGPLDVAGLAENRDQLWAEAVVAYRAKEAWWLSGEMESRARVAQEDRAIVDAWEGPLSELVEDMGSRAALLMRDRPYTTMAEAFKKLNIPVEKQGRSEQMRIAAVLTRLGLKRRKVRVGNTKTENRYFRESDSTICSQPQVGNTPEVGYTEPTED